MALETARDNQRAVELLEARRDDQVLEIGFGHGRTIREIAMRVPNGVVAGVEVSERMLRMASRLNRDLIDPGRVELKLAGGRAVPFESGRFDRLISVHTLYFWLEPADTLSEIARVAKPGARLVLGFRTADEAFVRDFPSSVYRFYRTDEVESLLERAGFGAIRFVRSKSHAEGTVFGVAERSG
jgi:SAM-dependent methyltransferase